MPKTLGNTADTEGGLPGLIARQAGNTSNAEVLLAPGLKSLTYERLQGLIAYLSRSLASLGIRRTDRIAVVLPGIDMAYACLAIPAVAVFAPLNPSLRVAEFEAALLSMKATAVLIDADSESPIMEAARRSRTPVLRWNRADGEFGGEFEPDESMAPSLETQSATPSPDDIAILLSTSGTTGRPKLVPLTHRNICRSAEDIRDAVSLTPGDRCLNVMPLHYIHGLSAVYASIAAGASVVCLPQFEPPRFFELLKQYAPTWYTAAPTIHQMILDQAARDPDITARGLLRFIRSASSGMPPQMKRQIEDLFGAPQIEAYGMTETSPQIASNRIDEDGRKAGSVGRPAGPDVAILDEKGRLVPALSAGEVVVRGANVTRGYLDDPAANEDAFRNGWFRTGDLGYLDRDGFLFITGRIKEIINRGGEKVSPREVDEALLSHPAVSRAVTFPVASTLLGEEVAAAVVLKAGESADALEIRKFVAGLLADYKVPSRILFVDSIPEGAGGKALRIGLADKLGLAQQEQTEAARPPFIAPKTPAEILVRDIFGKLLRVSDIGVDDAFDSLGGNSLLATLAITRIHNATKLRLSLIDFFQTPTVAGLARKIEERGSSASEKDVPPPILPRSASAGVLLSSSQRGLWFLEQLYSGSSAYNMHRIIRLRGKLNIAALRRSIQEISRRHEALRTVFPAVDGNPTASIAEAGRVPIEHTDLRMVGEEVRETTMRKVVAGEVGKRFDLARGPLLRAGLVQMGENDHILMLVTHHIVADGWSLQILIDELASLYSLAAEGNACSLPEPPCQFADFCLWQQQRLQGTFLESLEAYWKETLAGIPLLMQLPFDRPRPAKSSFRGAKHYFDVQASTLTGLAELAGMPAPRSL